MTLEAERVRIEIVRPALKALEPIIPWSQVAENIVLGTGAHESGDFKSRRQIGGGPALGLFEIEPNTLTDIEINYLKYRVALADKVEALFDGTDPLGKPHQLETNDQWGAALCRIKYFRAPAKLPADPDDVFDAGRLWAQFYNGRQSAQLYIDDYRRWVEDMPEAQIKALRVAAGGNP